MGRRQRVSRVALVVTLAVATAPNVALGDDEFGEASYWPTTDELRRELREVGREFRFRTSPLVQPMDEDRPDLDEHYRLEPDMYWQSGDLYLAATSGPLVVALEQQFSVPQPSALTQGRAIPLEPWVDLGFPYADAMDMASRLPLPPDTMQRVIRYLDGYESLQQLAEAEPCVRFDFAGGVIAVAAPASPRPPNPSWMFVAPTGALDYPVAYPEDSAPLYVDDCTSIPLDSPELANPAPLPSPSPNPADAPKVFAGTGPSWTDGFFLRPGSYTMRFSGSSCDHWQVALFHSDIVNDDEVPPTAVMFNTPEAKTGELTTATYYVWVGSVSGEPEDFADCNWTVTIEAA